MSDDSAKSVKVIKEILNRIHENHQLCRVINETSSIGGQHQLQLKK
ncbi:hypothetical protein FHU25_004672 [Clostridium saccharobutylicum]|nr:hypothetical protein [Clostridium saccharobutylicum]